MKKNTIYRLYALSRLIFLGTILFVPARCIQNDSSKTSSEKSPPDLAITWIKMQQKLFVGTPGLLPHVTGRVYGYVGLTLYESIAPGMPGYQSISLQLNGNLILPHIEKEIKYHWPTSANSALAAILRKLLPHAPPALLKEVDSLEAHFYNSFENSSNLEELERSSNFGKQIAAAIFEWSKTDGGHEAYKNPFSEQYTSPTGPGKWVSTGEYPFTQPVYPYWGNNRTFIPGIADASQPPPPPLYSEDPGSAFYNAAKEVYLMSQTLSKKDSMTAKFWAYELLDPNNLAEYEDVSHAANIATQLIDLKKLSLQDAAVLYCKHAIAGNDAGISCVKTKFHYNVVRPITYIRTVLGHSEWLPVVHTPPFPEYTSAHAAISMACASVLENTFGLDLAFTDYSFSETYGPRSFNSFAAYANEAALSRVQAGIHYRFAMDEGLKQGKKVAELVNQLQFKSDKP